MQVKGTLGGLSAVVRDNRTSKPQANAEQAAQKAASSADTVSISKEAAMLARGDAPETNPAQDAKHRADRLKDLKRLVRDGMYKPNLQQVALNLVRDDMAPLV